MIIDIDIKIADGEGNLIHRYGKHFDESINSKNVIGSINDLGKSFEDFLSEYMSFHGRMIREKLINETNWQSHPSVMVPNSDEYVSYGGASQEICDFSSDEDALDTYSNSEMEYRIRIGNNKILTGKIPFRNMNYKNPMVEKQNSATINETDNKSLQKDFKNDILKRYDSEVMEIEKGQNTSIKEINRQFHSLLKEKDKSEINIIINYAMTKAIEKYEANLSPFIYDTDNEALENDEKYQIANL